MSGTKDLIILGYENGENDLSGRKFEDFDYEDDSELYLDAISMSRNTDDIYENAIFEMPAIDDAKVIRENCARNINRRISSDVESIRAAVLNKGHRHLLNILSETDFNFYAMLYFLGLFDKIAAKSKVSSSDDANLVKMCLEQITVLTKKSTPHATEAYSKIRELVALKVDFADVNMMSPFPGLASGVFEVLFGKERLQHRFKYKSLVDALTDIFGYSTQSYIALYFSFKSETTFRF